MALTEDQKIRHFLGRASFGATAAEIEKVKAKGIPAYLEEQLEPDRLPDPLVEEKLKSLKTLSLSGSELLELYPPQQQAAAKGMTPARDQSPRFVIAELQRASTTGSHDRLLDQSLQRFRRQRRRPLARHRVRARNHPSARARPFSRSAAGHRAEPGDVVLSRQLAELESRRGA